MKALITGASSGIGEALAHLFAEKGISLLLTGRNLECLERLQKELTPQVSVEICSCDLSSIEGIDKVTALIEKSQPELVINNAGLGFYGPLVEQAEEIQPVIEVNITALSLLSQRAVKMMKDRGIKGVVLNVSSGAAFLPAPYLAVYAASKAYVNSFSASLDAEMREFGIGVLAACPGMVDTQFASRAGKTKLTFTRKLKSMTPRFAAECIFWQIEKRKKRYTFDWRTRYLVFLSRFLIPDKIVEKVMRKSITR